MRAVRRTPPITVRDIADWFDVTIEVVESWRLRRLNERMMSTAEVAAMVGVGVDTIEKWRSSGDGPPWRKFGRTLGGAGRRSRTLPRYKRADVLAWNDAKRAG